MPGKNFVKRIPACVGMIALLLFVLPTAHARYTPNDAFQERQATFEKSIANIKDQSKKEKVKKTDEMLYQINQKVCDRFEEDVNKMAAIMDELKRRQGITETRVAFGGVDIPIESADYWINYAAEAIAYQRAQNYTPNFSSETQIKSSLTSSMNRLENDLEVLKGKVLRAKTEVRKTL